MIPLIDDFLQYMVVDKLIWLKENPDVLDYIFMSSRRETLNGLKKFLTTRKQHVVIGYPKQQSLLPCYVITLAPEDEQYAGLGDDLGFTEDKDFGIGAEDDYVETRAQTQLSQFVSTTYMNSNYRIECWSDNGDLTAMMYVLLKWCIWTSRQEMLDLGWVNIRISGQDLEPAPEYLPHLIFRRGLNINLMYENSYFEHLGEFKKYTDIIVNPDDYTEDDKGNVVKPKTDENGDPVIDDNGKVVPSDDPKDVVIPSRYAWVMRPHYYKDLPDPEPETDYYIKVYRDDKLVDEATNIKELTTTIVDKLPDTGTDRTIYMLKASTSTSVFSEYMFIDNAWVLIGSTNGKVDLSKYVLSGHSDEKDTEILAEAKSYADSATYRAKEADGDSTFDDVFDTKG